MFSLANLAEGEELGSNILHLETPEIQQMRTTSAAPCAATARGTAGRGRQPRPQSPSGSNRVESEFRRHSGVIGAWRRYAGDRHVVVADRLYLFDSDIFSKLVEFAEQLIEAGDDFIGFHARRDFAEADNVGKNDSGVIEIVRNVVFPVAQACRDLSRQNVAQEVFGIPPLVLNLAHILIFQRS